MSTGLSTDVSQSTKEVFSFCSVSFFDFLDILLLQVFNIDPSPENVDPTWIPEATGGGVSNVSIAEEEPAFNVTEHRGAI